MLVISICKKNEIDKGEAFLKKMGRSKRRFLILIISILLLIVTGVLLTVRMFQNYSALILQNTDNQLMSLARSVDRSVDSHFARYIENLEHTVEHEECIEAEKRWLAGDGYAEEQLRCILEESLLGQDESIKDILILAGDEVALSQSGSEDYQLIGEGEAKAGVEIMPCLSREGVLYLAIIKNQDARSAYAILIDFVTFYENITENLSAELQNEIVMMDDEAATLIHRKEEKVVVDRVENFSEEDSKFQMLEFLLKQQETKTEGTDFCDAVSSATGRAYQARMAVVPASKESNGALAIGVSTDYDELTRPMRSGSIKLIIYGSTILLGSVSLLIMLLQTLRGSERAKQEIALLKEKNAAMEELNRQTQEFAHHQRLELMGTLTSGIAHEFNNLLAPIMGYSILILEKLPPEETELYDEVLEIYNTSTKAKTVVSRLQDLARKHAGSEMQKLLLDEVVQKAVDIARPAKPKPVELTLSLNGEDNYILGNETQLSQLLLNLLINAFHATAEIAGEVSVSTEIKDNRLLLKVADNGYGMSEEVKKRMYEPFFTTKKGGEGTGLGLAIVAQIVEEHGGSIQVETAEGKGTIFYVEFPVISAKS